MSTLPDLIPRRPDGPPGSFCAIGVTHFRLISRDTKVKVPPMKLDVLEEDGRWYKDGLRFTCQQAGNCCTGGPGYVWISEEEIGRLAEHLKLSPQQVIDRYCRRIGNRYSLNEHRNAAGQYDCVFLKEMKSDKRSAGQVEHSRRICTIYTVRPLQCRTWPFWDGLLESREAWDRAARRCPGMNQGRTWSQKEIEAIRDATDWPSKPPSSACSRK